jgi:hypothetical protein
MQRGTCKFVSCEHATSCLYQEAKMSLILKVFYGKEKCHNVYLDHLQVYDFKSLVLIIRQKISFLNFIADTDLRLEYEDDEGTFVRLEDGDKDAFMDALRCAKAVEGTDSRRLKIRVSESSTPQRKLQKLSFSPDAVLFRDVSINKDLSSDYSAYSIPSPATSSASSSASSRPARKQLNFEARMPSSTTTTTNPPKTINHRSPLERYLADAETQVSKQAAMVQKAQDRVDRFELAIPIVAKPKVSPSCGLCHRREKHNRVNCPYKPYKCESVFTCGDLEKHKDEKDELKRLQQELNTEKQKLKKLELQLKCKKESQTKTVNSFNAKMRKRLVASNEAKYLSDGRENWRVINMDLSLLDQHFKGKVPDDNIDLQEVLEDIRIRRLPGSKHCDQVKELWKMKGITWPGSSTESAGCIGESRCEKSSCSTSSKFYSPADKHEENEQLQIALRESLNINKQHINIENEAETQPAAPIAMPIETKETYDDDDKATAQMLLDILYSSTKEQSDSDETVDEN